MSRHSFNPAIAEQVGVNAAVIYQNIVWWCEKNAANGTNIHEGRPWTFNSMRAFSLMFQYLTERQIRTALQKLEDVGLVLVGNFNRDARDRTKWYSVDDITVTKHLTKKSEPFDQKVAPLPDSKPDNKQTPISPEGNDLFSENPEPCKNTQTVDPIETGFNEFWETIWPKHQRKTGEADCKKVYRQACVGKHPKAKKIAPADLNAATKRYIASVTDRQFLKGPLPWLRLPGWEAFIGADAPDTDKPLSYAQKVLRARAAGGTA